MANEEKHSFSNIDSCNDMISEMFYGADEIIFEYTFDGLPFFAIKKRAYDNKYVFEIDSAITFENDRGAKIRIKKALQAFAKWMVENDYDVSFRMDFNKLFSDGIDMNRGYSSIEETYAAFRVLALGFISGLKSEDDNEENFGELIDRVQIGYDPEAKVWVAVGEPPFSFALEHENIVTLAELVWKLIPEMKELETPHFPEFEKSWSEEHQESTEKIFIGHNYGGAVWIRAVLLDISDRIAHIDVHEVGKEISVDLELFDDEFEEIFLRHFDQELEVNKHRFTTAFTDGGRYLKGFEKNILEPNFFTQADILQIVDELKTRGREYDLKLAELLRVILNEAPEGSFISVMS